MFLLQRCPEIPCMCVDVTFYSLLVTWCTNSLTFNNCMFCPHCIHVFCIYLRTNSDLCHLQHKLIGFYNRDEKCLLRGTDWVFKYSGLRFVFKGFIWEQTATCATYSINRLVFITEMKSVYCAVRTGSLNKAVCASSLKGLFENKQRLVPLTA